jgi:hypothetical protein
MGWKKIFIAPLGFFQPQYNTYSIDYEWAVNGLKKNCQKRVNAKFSKLLSLITRLLCTTTRMQ